MSFYELLNFLFKIRQLFPELLQPACSLCCTFHGGASENMPCVLCVRPCPTSSCRRVPRDGNVLLFLSVSTLGEGGVEGVGAGCGRTRLLQWDSGRSLQECCRDRGARSYRRAGCSVPRELCQRGQEEKTHSSNTQ